MSTDAARQLAETVARRSYGKLVAFLAAQNNDVASAEDGLSEAFAAALLEWPVKGCPANPEGWLLTVARRRAIDSLRRSRRGEVLAAQFGAMALGPVEADTEIPDRRLALMFACTHPAIDRAIRAPLILQTVLGLDAAAIASSFLTSPTAMSKRLVRAKDKIRHAGIRLQVPQIEEMAERLPAVLDAIYAAFSEGWTDAAGTDAARRNLTEEALFLANLAAKLLPKQPEALGLLALMLHTEARRKARRDAQGEYVPMAEQNTELWDSQMIFEAERLLRRAIALGAPGRYQLEAAVQSAHVYRCRTGLPNWSEIAQLYDTLFALTRSPVVAINRALAVSETQGADAALAVLAGALEDTRLAEYQPYWAARAELLARTGATTEACHAYEVAAGLERDDAVRRFLQRRQSALRSRL